MKVLSWYVSRTVLAAMLLVLLLLLGLDVVFSFIAELEDLRADYRTPQALLYVLMTAPRRAYDLLPIAALVGGIAGLGMLANNSELTVMRAAGVSIIRIVWWVLKPALILVVAGLLLGQYVIPQTERLAEHRRASALGQPAASGALRSYWHRDGDRIVRIGAVADEGVLSNLMFFHLDAGGRLVAIVRAAEAHYQGRGWELRGLTETRLNDDGGARVVQREGERWESELEPRYLRLVTLDPEYLSLSSLYAYAGYLKEQGLDAESYYLEFWKKALAPLATISMVLIACSFIFGPLRSVTLGFRIITGVLVGLVFRYGQDAVGFASILFHWSPLAAVALPIAVCLLAGSYALYRVR